MSYKFAINIAGNNSPLNLFPMLFEHETIRDWSNEIRSEDNIFALLDWALAYYITPSQLKLYVLITKDDMEWEYKINLSNVREYKKWIGTDTDELQSIIDAWRRDQKLDEILEG